MTKWGIFCEVWGGITGRRSAWLKSNGKLAVFSSREEAEAEAKLCNDKTNGNPHRTASFAYTVRPLGKNPAHNPIS
jgi:hypothetical protein